MAGSILSLRLATDHVTFEGRDYLAMGDKRLQGRPDGIRDGNDDWLYGDSVW
jgi:hypothetical protein